MRLKYFAFSVKYIVLTALTYLALVATPYMIFKSKWSLAIVALAFALACFRLIYATLVEYFISINKTKHFAEVMTVVTLFPPIIGPIIVLAYSLD